MDSLLINVVGFSSLVMVNVMKLFSVRDLISFMDVSNNWSNSVGSLIFKRIHYEFTSTMNSSDVLECIRYREFTADDYNLKVQRDRNTDEYFVVFNIHPTI